MAIGKRLLWGGIGWAFGGPIGGIIGFALATMSEQQAGAGSYNFGGGYRSSTDSRRTQPGDFAVALLVLLASVMKADRQLLKSELEYVKQFLLRQFSPVDAQELMTLFRDILEQDYPLRDVCRQIQHSMDHPSRLELIHVLFGLSMADGQIHPQEDEIIRRIARWINVNDSDFDSIQAMFIGSGDAAYKILEINSDVNDEEVKKAYRRMANKYHPDKVEHLGTDLRKLAEEKFKSVNDAYQSIKKERRFT
ncbi:MAG: TerB family tellurite resistance protein [Candidatus Neomarinimicrobiota bacterium]